MFKRFLHRLSHILGNNIVKVEVYWDYPANNFGKVVKCEGCGMVRFIDGNTWFYIEENEK